MFFEMCDSVLTNIILFELRLYSESFEIKVGLHDNMSLFLFINQYVLLAMKYNTRSFLKGTSTLSMNRTNLLRFIDKGNTDTSSRMIQLQCARSIYV